MKYNLTKEQAEAFEDYRINHTEIRIPKGISYKKEREFINNNWFSTCTWRGLSFNRLERCCY
jgi:hypothetical protein